MVSDKIDSITKTYKVVTFNGMFWGIEYKDAQCEACGWVSIENAKKSTYEGFIKPEDLTYKNSPYIEELKKGKIITIEQTTNYRIVEEKK